MKMGWGTIKWAVDRWQPVGRGPWPVNDYRRSGKQESLAIGVIADNHILKF